MKDIIEEYIRDEGIRLTPYKDTLGNWTVGIGHLMSNPISREAAELIFIDDFKKAITELEAYLPVFKLLDKIRQDVLINMCFNLGIGGLLKFKKMIDALEVGNYVLAATEMLRSNWSEQVGERAIRLSEKMRSSKT